MENKYIFSLSYVTNHEKWEQEIFGYKIKNNVNIENIIYMGKNICHYFRINSLDEGIEINFQLYE